MGLNRILPAAVILYLFGTQLGSLAAPLGAVDPATRATVEQMMLALPLRFEENAGSFDPSVKYLARAPGYTLYLTLGESILTLPQKAKKRPAPGRGKERFSPPTKASVLRVRLEGANDSPSLRGENKLAAPTSYLLGNDPAKWSTASNYDRVRLRSVYPGVDMLYYGKKGGVEYDFELAPGADPARIVLHYNGARQLRLDADSQTEDRREENPRG